MRINNLFTFLCLQCVVYSYSNVLPCQSEQDDLVCAVHCTAILYEAENCTDQILSRLYPGLYRQIYWPDRPNNLQLLPIQDEWPEYPKWLLPGFIVQFDPPPTVSIQYIRGFQLNFEYGEEKTPTKKCVVIQILNETLNSDHRENNIKFVSRLYPLPGETDFVFTAWSLPKPPPRENRTNQVRYGTTGLYGLTLNTMDSVDWKTTISYYNNLEDYYIQIWFVPAPEKYNFMEYNVTLDKVLKNEGKYNEVRESIYNNRIMETEYTFWNVKPGRYRATVLPYDDGSDTLSHCKCNRNGGCQSCLRTITSVIDVPEDNLIAQNIHSTPSAIVTSPTTLEINSERGDNSTRIQELPNPNYVDGTHQHILPSVLGFVAFLLIVVIVIGCYKFHHHNVDNPISPTSPAAITNQCPSISYHLKDKKSGKTTVSVIHREDDEDHNNVAHCFATFLQKICDMDVLFYPWNFNEDKFHWIANTIDKSDYIVFLISQSAVDQYDMWIREDAYNLNRHSSDLFMTILKNVLNLRIENLQFENKLIMIKFDHTQHISISKNLNMKQFLLNKQLKDFLCHIHGLNIIHPDLSRTYMTIDPNLRKSQEGRNLLTAIKRAVNNCREISSDSGYPVEEDQKSIKSAITLDKDDLQYYNTENHSGKYSCPQLRFDRHFDIDFLPPADIDSLDILSVDLHDEIKNFNLRNYGELDDGHSV